MDDLPCPLEDEDCWVGFVAEHPPCDVGDDACWALFDDTVRIGGDGPAPGPDKGGAPPAPPVPPGGPAPGVGGDGPAPGPDGSAGDY